MRLLTTDQAMYRLGMSRGTFFSRLKEHPEITPVNHNPNLKKRHNPLWRIEDVDKLGIAIHPEEVGAENPNPAAGNVGAAA